MRIIDKVSKAGYTFDMEITANDRQTKTFTEKMNRKQIVIADKETLEDNDREYWKNAAVKEKLQTITYLRECFYGKEATTGRLQRLHTMLKLKQG